MGSGCFVIRMTRRMGKTTADYGHGQSWSRALFGKLDFSLAAGIGVGGFGQAERFLSSCSCGNKLGMSLWIMLHKVSLSIPR